MNRPMVISLIGRPNVGKSTLFNRLQDKMKKAITHNQPGVTRDRHYALVHLDNHEEGQGEVPTILVDTGGFYPQEISSLGETKAEKELHSLFNIMREHAQLAMAESDLILLIVDVREGPLPYDWEICKYLRASQRPFWIVINKSDSHLEAQQGWEFCELGVDPSKSFLVSASHGLGITPLKMALAKTAMKFQQVPTKVTTHTPNSVEDKAVTAPPFFSISGTPPLQDKVVASLCLIGPPNGGKSTLLNQLLGHTRALVSKLAGTTVDTVEDYFKLYLGKEVLPGKDALSDSWGIVKVIDTAGIRKKSQVKGYLEHQSVYRALKAMGESSIAICVVDATREMSHQERRLVDIALDKGVSVIVALNKMDLLEQQFTTAREKREWLLDLKDKIPWLDFCPLVPISAKDGKHLEQLKKALRETIRARSRHIPTSKLNQVVSRLLEKNPLYPKATYRRALKVKYATIVKDFPLTILLFANRSKNIPPPYRRYLQKGIRQAFALKNTPIHLVFRTGEKNE